MITCQLYIIPLLPHKLRETGTVQNILILAVHPGMLFSSGYVFHEDGTIVYEPQSYSHEESRGGDMEYSTIKAGLWHVIQPLTSCHCHGISLKGRPESGLFGLMANV
jgi:hypothetical protein